MNYIEYMVYDIYDIGVVWYDAFHLTSNVLSLMFQEYNMSDMISVWYGNRYTMWIDISMIRNPCYDIRSICCIQHNSSYLYYTSLWYYINMVWQDINLAWYECDMVKYHISIMTLYQYYTVRVWKTLSVTLYQFRIWHQRNRIDVICLLIYDIR